LPALPHKVAEPLKAAEQHERCQQGEGILGIMTDTASTESFCIWHTASDSAVGCCSNEQLSIIHCNGQTYAPQSFFTAAHRNTAAALLELLLKAPCDCFQISLSLLQAGEEVLGGCGEPRHRWHTHYLLLGTEEIALSWFRRLAVLAMMQDVKELVAVSSGKCCSLLHLVLKKLR